MIEEDHAMEVGIDDGQIERMNANEIFQLIKTLPDGYRTVFNLHVIEGYSHKEIGTIMNITEGTSKSQLNKARAVLQKVMKQRMLQ